MEAIQKVQDKHQKEREALQRKHDEERETLRKEHLEEFEKVRAKELDTLLQERKVLHEALQQVIREKDEGVDEDLRELMGELRGLALLDASTGPKRVTEEDDDSVVENSDTTNVQSKCVKTCSCTFTGCNEKNGKGSHRPGTCLNAPAKVGNVCSACTKFKFRKTKVTLPVCSKEI
jgi:hypothetical protein